jgi:prophage regulatory protein
MIRLVEVKVSLKLLRFRDLKAMGVPWSRMHIDRLERDGKFPKRVQLGESTVAWLENEVEEFLSAKVAARNAA